MGPGPGAGCERNLGVRVGDSPRVGGGGVQSGQDGCTGGTVLDVTDSESSQQSEIEEDEEEGYLIPPKRKRIATAPVWECATKVEGGAQCKICPKVIKLRMGNTTNIVAHILKKHPSHTAAKKLKIDLESKKEIAKQKKKLKAKTKINSSILSFVTKKGSIDRLKEKRLNEAVIQMIVSMNNPFMDVENHFFRKLLFTAEPNYVVPSRHTITRKFDDMAVKVKNDLKNEIVNDVTMSGLKTISITSDHGTSDDRFRSKKNTVNVIRTTKDYRIKINLVKMILCKKSQTGLQIRRDVKDVLEECCGLEDDWIVNWVTDGEKKQISARKPNNHPDVGLKINYDATCVDHTMELVSEDTIDTCKNIGSSVKKLRVLVNHFKESLAAREKLHDIMEESGEKPLTIIQGTSNRWFFKYSEAKRALLLREIIDKFFDQYEFPEKGKAKEKVEPLDEEDWDNVLLYENVMRNIVEASVVLEGALYPTSSSVIPFLDTVAVELKKMKNRVKIGDQREYVETFLNNLHARNRFPDNMKTFKPYNILTLLDPRYGDLYFTALEKHIAVNDLIMDPVYDDQSILDIQKEDSTPTPPPTPVTTNGIGDAVSKRR